MDEAKKDAMRSQILKATTVMLSKEGKPSAEYNQAAVEALCSMAGAMFATTHPDVPYDSDPTIRQELAEAPLNGLYDWLELWRARHN